MVTFHILTDVIFVQSHIVKQVQLLFDKIARITAVSYI